MQRVIPVFCSIAAISMTACSKAPTPVPQPAHAAPATTVAAAADADDPNVLSSKLTTGHIQTQYAAHFTGSQLARIVETRRIGDVTLGGEYAYQGARLLRYQGAKIGDTARLDLQFDLQGTLQSGQGSGVSDEDIRAIRNRAQLLRSHALAGRATRNHGH